MQTVFSYIDPVAFRLGSLEIRWYGLIITSAIILGLFLLIKMGHKKGVSTDDSLSLFLWLIPLAVIFARLVYVIANNSKYHFFPVESWDDFVDVIAIWHGGATIIGGVLGGIIGALIFSKIHKVKFAVVLDILVPIVLLCQSIGRWGNFFNQEAFGRPITDAAWQWFPFAVYIDSPSAGVPYGWYGATFFYEGVFNLLGAVLLYLFWRKNKVDGTLIFCYMVWYFTVRFFLDFMRVDGLVVTRVSAVIVVAVSTALGILYYRRGLAKIEHQKVHAEILQMLDEAD